ncbi:hypothetical protein TNCV_2158711 [Trichonephila clavipes]|nr:hypothetical protein TNCV_2158711 [Trichonephila clavipes]
MATGSFLTQNYSRSQSEMQGDLHNGEQRINPENRVGSGFRIIPEQYFSGVENINAFLENIDNNLSHGDRFNSCQVIYSQFDFLQFIKTIIKQDEDSSNGPKTRLPLFQIFISEFCLAMKRTSG